MIGRNLRPFCAHMTSYFFFSSRKLYRLPEDFVQPQLKRACVQNQDQAVGEPQSYLIRVLIFFHQDYQEQTVYIQLYTYSLYIRQISNISLIANFILQMLDVYIHSQLYHKIYYYLMYYQSVLSEVLQYTIYLSYIVATYIQRCKNVYVWCMYICRYACIHMYM